MKTNRIALAETYGLALVGIVRGLGEVIVNEASDRLHDRQIKSAPDLGKITLSETGNHDLPKAA